MNEKNVQGPELDPVPLSTESDSSMPDELQGEETSEDISTEEVINVLRELKDQGIDFDEEDTAHISAMDAEERVYYLFQALLEAGLEDPEAVLKEKGVFWSKL